MKQCITIFALLLGISSLSGPASAHPIVQYWQNRAVVGAGLILEPRFSFYTADEHFNDNADRVSLPSGVLVNRQYLDLNAGWAIDERWTLFGRLSILRTAITGSPTGDNSAIGLGDQLVGANYRFYSAPGGARLSAQLDVTIPAYSNGTQKQNGEPYLGDQSYDVVLGSFAWLPISASGEWATELGAGVRVRSHSFSTALPYSALLRREPIAGGWSFHAGARGQLSFNTDGSSAIAGASDQILGGGGSDLIYAINPAWMVAQAGTGYQTEGGSRYSVFAAYPLFGKNAPAGLQLSVSAAFAFGAPPTPGPISAAAAPETPTPSKASRPGPTGGKVSHKTDENARYALNAEVTSVNDALYLCKIDMGSADGVMRGQIFDIFRFVTDSETGLRRPERVARAQVTSVKSSEAALSVIEYFIDQWVEVGFIARRLVE